jgi:hypothetical protein
MKESVSSLLSSSKNYKQIKREIHLELLKGEKKEISQDAGCVSIISLFSGEGYISGQYWARRLSQINGVGTIETHNERFEIDNYEDKPFVVIIITIERD